MNREANTILSKANDMEITDYAIHLKTEIEKILVLLVPYSLAYLKYPFEAVFLLLLLLVIF